MKDKKLGLIGLIALVIGGVIGGGIFSLPSQLAQGAGAFAIILGFLISGIGIFSLAFVFQILSKRKPELTNGIYRYSREGFGEYMGFNAAWIYWLSSTFGNVAYATLVFGSLSYFFNIFNPSGNNLASIIAASILIWAITFLILRGVRQAIILNTIVTISKIIPIILFIILGILAFHMKNFNFQFYGDSSLGSIFKQVKNTMIATLWAFGGIEAAVVLSGRAKRVKDVGYATVIGLVGIISIYILITFISLGVMKRPEIAKLHDPSMAYILQYAVGKWGAVVINIGLIISVLGALLGWSVIVAEMPYSTAKDNVMPKFLTKENKNGAPINSLILTTAITELWLIFSYVSSSGYEVLYSLASTASLVAYFLSTLYLIKLVVKGETYKDNSKGRILHFIIALLSLIYTIWLLYAANLKYILFNCIVFAFGLILFIWNKKERKLKIFDNWYELIISIIFVLIGIVSIILIITGYININ